MATQNLPQAATVGRQKLSSMMTAASQAASQTYGPKLGPTGGPPLTKSQAEQLVKNSFPGERYRIVQPYVDDLVKYMIQHSVDTPANERRSFDTLERLSKNVCNYEILSGNIARMEKTIIEMHKSLSVKDIPNATRDLEEGVLPGIAFQIVDGYDVVDQTHFVFDADGNPIDVTETNRLRKPLCYKKVKEDVSLKQSGPRTIGDPSSFRDFLQKQSDPFKGSQQGYGKKTRKHKKRSKKTRKHKH
jgi:hypothetical protein